LKITEIICCAQGAQRPVDVGSAPTGAAAETAPGRAQCTTFQVVYNCALFQRGIFQLVALEAVNVNAPGSSTLKLPGKNQDAPGAL